MTRTRALLPACQAQTGQSWAVQWRNEDSWEGRGGGNFTAWMLACLVVTCVQYEPINKLFPLWPVSPNWSICQGRPMGGSFISSSEAEHSSNLSPSLFLPTSVFVSPSSVCEPCCDHCSDRRKRLFVQDPVTCRCSCKYTDEHCKERQLELNERTCKWVSTCTRVRCTTQSRPEGHSPVPNPVIMPSSASK